ncbi:MAG: membrane integrity-associated transporter subunit PqiC [Verrucomicrobiae bacterium]|jgi:uncharacterized lipoprotein YmbA|nr:membrane integrity-associated transporter subunit PqiC [Verrucomicrobiae bacterium]
MMKALLAATLALLTLTGCVNLDPAPDNARHFTLAATAVSGNANRPALAVAVMPVVIPDFLKRSNIIMRKSADELDISPFSRWAEPLENGIARVVAQNLTTLLNSRFIRTSDQRATRKDELQLNINVIEFTTSPTGEARVVIESKLIGPDGQSVVTASRTRLTTPPAAEPADTAKAVAALSDTLRQYAEQLAAVLLQSS